VNQNGGISSDKHDAIIIIGGIVRQRVDNKPRSGTPKVFVLNIAGDTSDAILLGRIRQSALVLLTGSNSSQEAQARRNGD
jgi:hypothetical protein